MTTVVKQTQLGKGKTKGSHKHSTTQTRKRQRSLAELMDGATADDESSCAGAAGKSTADGDANPDPTRTSTTRGGSKRSRSQAARNHNALVSRAYIEKLVAYSPVQEVWLKDSVYSDVGSAYIVGRTALCHADQSEIEVQEDASDIEAVENEEEESFHRYDPEFVFPSSMTKVEAIN
ncbi:uncharacterized protein PITG_20070 [Phytophthora infestans T30-4]|uniref:Uncharacterized protein n=1 Tax=Phytophthora infestans (strain T30-4) TaxID=403677 RepID=D0P128_PHYIT|nr:uncharacterized protein PITG_20070 [Phytophthora infestans T30-4]EEY53743.1 hypothetical protein PITG_20070 [Phytophthora infestans T30-4]|eukprot:XP_002895990.1 hypothetical protein PITG_20070 [Phytophthora infestans T30-4]